MSTDRLPPLSWLTDAQRAAADRLVAGPRGALSGPFVPLLRSPELMTRLQLVGEYLRFGSVLDDDLVELVVLTVARAWNQAYEWGFHQPIALAKGLSPSVVEAVGQGRRPDGGAAVGLVWDLVDELQRTGEVSDDVYDAAVTSLGEERVVEVVATAGYYTTLAMIMNVARTPPPDGAPELP